MLSSDCDISIELDDPRRTFEASQPLSGTVRVQVGEEVECNGLSLHRHWETHGRGNRASGGEYSDVLFEGTWQPGRTYEYPFKMPLPPGPYTYHGHYINVDWFLEAEADIPWSLDPSAKKDFILEPGDNDRYIAGSKTEQDFRESRPDDDNLILWGRVILGGFFALFSSGIIVGLLAMGGLYAGFLLFSAFTSLFLAAGLWLIYTGIRNVFAEQQLGDVDVELSDARPAPGEELECRVHMDPPDEVELNQITCDLMGYERAQSGHGTDSTTYNQTIHQEEIIPDDSVSTTLRASDAPTFAARFRLPESAPYSFNASDNDVKWRLEVHVDIPGWPDWNHEEPLLVRPAPDEAQTSSATSTQKNQNEMAW